MNNCVSKTTFKNDVHANPYIDWSKNALLILLIFASVIKEDTMKKLFAIDLGERGYLDLFLTIAAESGLLCRISSLNSWIGNILSSWQIFNFMVCITDVSLSERSHIFVLFLSFIHQFSSKQEWRSGISRRGHIDSSCILLCDWESRCSTLSYECVKNSLSFGVSKFFIIIIGLVLDLTYVYNQEIV